MGTREELILSVGNYIHSLVQKYRRPSDHDYEDLVQQGWIGAIEAADTFNPDLNCKFVTHASWCILNHVMQGIKANHGIIAGFLNKGTGLPFSKIYFNMSKMPVSSLTDITHKMCVDFAEQMGVKTEEVLEYLTLSYSEGGEGFKDFSSVESMADNTIRLEEVDEVLSTFSDKAVSAYRDCIEGYIHPDIADRHDMSRQWVGFTLSAINKKLKEIS